MYRPFRLSLRLVRFEQFRSIPSLAIGALANLSVCLAPALAETPTSQPAVRVTTIEGKSIEGTWDGVGADGLVLLRADQGRQISLSPQELMAVRFGEPTASQPATDGGFLFYLADGGRFGGRISTGGGRDLQVLARGDIDLHISLDSLAGVGFSDRSFGEAETIFAKALAERDASQDILITQNQGRVTSIKGATEQLSPQGGSFRWRERSIPIRPDSAYGIVFARGVQAPATAAVQCLLRDASVWSGSLLTGDTQHVAIKSSLGPELRFPLGAVSELRFRSGRVVFVSDFEPKQYVFEAFVATRWPYRRNRSVSNLPLRLGGQTYEHGIGMHSQSRLAYELSSPFSQLAATIGIDDAVRPRGSVIFRVMADGKEVFNSGTVGGGDLPRPILVALASPKRLELCVDFGDALDIGDHADWAQLRLIK